MEIKDSQRIILSFCITVYNQSELVKKCISSILSYKGNDIEIIVSDDDSTEDVESVSKDFHDQRIRYFKNDENLGHDRNILKAIERARGEYVLVLRSRDSIISESIPDMISVLKDSVWSYVVFSAVNEKNKPVLHFRDTVYIAGSDAISAHFRLFFHPSGNVYRRDLVKTKELYQFLDEKKVTKLGLVVHNMIRLQLAEEGDFKTSSIFGWMYATSENGQDKAYNRGCNRKSVYHPEYVLQRFLWESAWNREHLSEQRREEVLLQLIEFYLYQITWTFKIYNSNKKMQKHYDYERIRFSALQQQKKFREQCIIHIENEYDKSKDDYLSELQRIFAGNITAGFGRYIIMRLTSETELYRTASNVYKRMIKKL